MDKDNSRGARYSHVAITLHWIIAAMILANFILVWSAEDAPKAEEQRLVGLHMANGISIMILSVLRILWRVTHPKPPFEESLKSWEVALANVVHGLFYFLMIAIPLTGWLMTSVYTGGMGVNVFGLFEFPGLPFAKSEAGADTLHEVHEVLAALMLLLFLLHTAAALKHMFVDRDDTMGRMIPLLRRKS